MGGGDGAKERRRQKRLAKQLADGTPADGQKSTLGQKSTSTGNDKSRQKSPSKTSGPKGGSISVKNKQMNSRYKKPTPPAKKKKKFQKPKHLKRKLEQLSSADDDGKRELVLKEIEDFEITKQKLSNHKVPQRKKIKKVKKTNFSSQSSPNKREKIAPSEHEEEKEPTNMTGQVNMSEDEVSTESPGVPFPRGGTIGDSSVNRMKLEPAETKENDESNKDDSDEEQEEETNVKRQRGRRRRGRKDTSKQILEDSKKVEEKKLKSELSSVANVDDPSHETTECDGGKKKLEAKKDDNRYCLGRKPVTDFIIGQKYSGKVVYVKPFGVFFDIGCHSDAFCHVSRLRDDFVENPQEIFHEGDVVEGIRLVEIDRKQKRLTVSLQSEGRVADEKASMEAREQRKKSRKRKNTYLSSSLSSKGPQNDSAEHTQKRESGSRLEQEQKQQKASHVVFASNNSNKTPISTPKIKSQGETTPRVKSEAEMTPAELKRARKLARRAARREQATASAE